MSNKLNKSLEQIEEVFQKMKNKGISVGGGRVSDRTIKTYTDMIKSLMREANERFGVAQIRKIKQEHIDEIVQSRIDKYHSGDTSQSYNLKTLTAAIKSFNFGVANTRVFDGKRKFEVGDTEKIRKTMKNNYVIRSSKASTVMRGTPEQCEIVLDNIKKTGFKTETQEIAYHVAYLAYRTGGRATGILGLRAGDIRFDSKKSTITYIGDKGGLTRSVELDKDTIKYLKELSKGKAPNQKLFAPKRNNGTFKSPTEIRKEISKVVAEAGKDLTTTEMVKMKNADGNHVWVPVEKKVSLHFFRKGFTVWKTEEYYQMFKSEDARKKWLEEKIKENPKVQTKLDIVKERINKTRKTDRELTTEEYAIFATSLDIGHFRNSVITSFYTTFQEVDRYYRGK